jgi:sigma-B regulation protein RsbU (phosphoserine phosphatase)
VSTLFVTSRKRSLLWRRVLRIELAVVFVGLVIYAFLTSIYQRASLLVIMIAVFVVGNLLIPLHMACRRLYVARPFPWNWIVFFPVQILFGVIYAVSSILFLQLTQIDPEPFSSLFTKVGHFAIVVAVVASVIGFGVEEFQRELKERNEQLERSAEQGTIALHQQEEELKRAREIQQMLLPSTLPQLARVQIAGAWQPAREVGGDYFDVIRLDKNRLGICVGDVAGKGITAALLMANLQASFRAFATTEASPQLVCTRLNKFLCANIASGKFVTFFYAVLDADARTLTYENAGHSPGLLLRGNGTTEALRGGGAVLGALPDLPGLHRATSTRRPAAALDRRHHGGRERPTRRVRRRAPARSRARTRRKRPRSSTRHHAAGHGLLRWKLPRRRNLTCSTNLLNDAGKFQGDTPSGGRLRYRGSVELLCLTAAG